MEKSQPDEKSGYWNHMGRSEEKYGDEGEIK